MIFRAAFVFLIICGCSSSSREQPEQLEQQIAILPQEYKSQIHISIAIEQMQIGDVKYTWKSGMVVDDKDRCWLRPRQTVYDQPIKTFEIIKITRTKEGYIVQPMSQNTTWHTFAEDYTKYIPVHEFKAAE